MRFLALTTILMATIALAAPAADPELAWGKCNEYPTKQCLNTDGTNTPTYPHAPLCGCVRMDSQTESAYIANSKWQRTVAFTNADCNPGDHKEFVLGKVGGGCRVLDSEFSRSNPGATIQSMQYWVSDVCIL